MARIGLYVAPTGARPHRPNGYVLYEGPSRHDGKPIVVVATNLWHASENPKTGPMVQVWVLRQDVKPADAVKTGADASVCNDCPFRASLRKEMGGTTACYVRADAAINQVWRTYAKGGYPRLTRTQAQRLFQGRRVRGAAYGNMTNVPMWVSRLWAGPGKKWTQYDHNWRKAPAAFARLAMASVGSPAERAEAKQKGWRTFRVKQPAEPVLPGEKECPAQTKARDAGHYVTCYDCLQCHGGTGPDIVIDDHGPGSANHTAKLAAARALRATVDF